MPVRVLPAAWLTNTRDAKRDALAIPRDDRDEADPDRLF